MIPHQSRRGNPASGAAFPVACALLLCLPLAPVSAQLRVLGATTIQPVVQSVREDYREATGTELSIRGGGSGIAAAAVCASTADIGMISRPLTVSDCPQLGNVLIGYDAVAIIANAYSPLKSVTRSELRAIYTVRDGSEHVLVSKLIDRGTLAIFEGYTGLRSPFHPDTTVDSADTISPDAWEAGANLDVILWVAGLRTAIGFVSYSDAVQAIEAGMPIRILNVDWITPTSATIAAGEYPLTRPLYLVFRRDDHRAAAFARFMLTDQGQDHVTRLGFVGNPTDATVTADGIGGNQ